MANAGMRGPGLLSATDQPLITSAPARTGRGTSEIVDEFGRRFPTRPPVHIEPQDAILPTTRSGPVGFGERPPGELTTAASLAAERAGMGPITPPASAPLVGGDQISQWNEIMRQGGFVAPMVAARVSGAALGRPHAQAVRVHCLVAAAFLGPRPARNDVRHLDGDRGNNVAANLAYGTRAENMADAIGHGTTMRGERSAAAKLTAEHVRVARDLRATGHTYSQLASRFGVSGGTVRDACLRITWGHLV